MARFQGYLRCLKAIELFEQPMKEVTSHWSPSDLESHSSLVYDLLIMVCEYLVREDRAAEAITTKVNDFKYYLRKGDSKVDQSEIPLSTSSNNLVSSGGSVSRKSGAGRRSRSESNDATSRRERRRGRRMKMETLYQSCGAPASAAAVFDKDGKLPVDW